MNAHTRRLHIDGPAGALALAVDDPAGPARGVALLCHPHPLHGGTMDNKVVMTLARAFVQCGWQAVRFNFRGVDGSAGAWDEGRGEVDDVLAVVAALEGLAPADSARDPALPLALGGFSFGAAMAARAAARLAAAPVAPAAGARTVPQRLVLVGPAVANFPAPPVSQDTLVIHGEADEVVPLQAVLDWARPQTLPVTVVPGVGHFFHGQLAVLKRLVVAACR